MSTHPGHSLSGQRSLPLLHVIGDAVLGEHGSNGAEDHVVGELLLRALFVACIGNDSKCLSAGRATGIVSLCHSTMVSAAVLIQTSTVVRTTVQITKPTVPVRIKKGRGAS